MASTNVHVVMTSAEANLVQGWLRARQSVKGFTDEVNRAGQASQRTNRRTQGGYGRATQDLQRAALGMAGIASAAQAFFTFAELARNEIEQIRRVQQESREALVPFGRMMQQFAVTAPKRMDITVEEIERRILEAQARFEPRQQAAIAAAAISKGEDPMRTGERLEMAIAAMESLTMFEPDEVKEISKAATLLLKAWPTDDKVEKLGTILTALTQSPAGLENISEFSQNIVSGAALLEPYGFTEKEALAEIIAIMERSGDEQGRQSRTAYQKLAMDVRTELIAMGRQDIADIGGSRMIDFVTTREEDANRLRAKMLGLLDEQLRQDAAQHGMTMQQMLQLQAGDKANYRGLVRSEARARLAVYERLQAVGTAEGPLQTKSVLGRLRQDILTGEEAGRYFRQRTEESKQQASTVAAQADTLNEALKQGLYEQSEAIKDVTQTFINDIKPFLDTPSTEKMIEAMGTFVVGAADNEVEALRRLYRSGERARHFERYPRRLTAIQAYGGGPGGVPAPQTIDRQAAITMDMLTERERENVRKLDLWLKGVRELLEAAELRQARQQTQEVMQDIQERGSTPIQELIDMQRRLGEINQDLGRGIGYEKTAYGWRSTGQQITAGERAVLVRERNELRKQMETLQRAIQPAATEELGGLGIQDLLGENAEETTGEGAAPEKPIAVEIKDDAGRAQNERLIKEVIEVRKAVENMNVPQGQQQNQPGEPQDVRIANPDDVKEGPKVGPTRRNPITGLQDDGGAP